MNREDIPGFAPFPDWMPKVGEVVQISYISNRAVQNRRMVQVIGQSLLNDAVWVSNVWRPEESAFLRIAWDEEFGYWIFRFLTGIKYDLFYARLFYADGREIIPPPRMAESDCE